MTKQVQIWDKVSSINGVPAEKVTPNWTNVEEVVLILDENGRVLEMNDPAILKQNLGITEDKTALEIGQAYLDFLTQQEIKAKQEQVSIQDIQTQLNDITSALADILGGDYKW